MTTSILREIVYLEWEMFQHVNGDTHVSCQENPEVFVGMRMAQLSAWYHEVTDSYLKDLMDAEKSGRNLLREKYINMMATTSPEQFAVLAKDMLKPSPLKLELVDRLTGILMEQTRVLHAEYPYIARSGRPLSTADDSENRTSVETYQRGELLTYSESTVGLLLKQVQSMALKGESLPKKILENIVRFYGYSDLNAAEEAAAKRTGRSS